VAGQIHQPRSRGIDHQHRPERPVLLAVDQELGEDVGLEVPPVAADPVGAVEVREREDLETLGTRSKTEGV